MVRKGKIVLALLVWGWMLLVFQNCGVVKFETGVADASNTDSQNPPLPQDQDPNQNSEIEIAIPSQAYDKLSESPFFKVADRSTGLPELSNFKLYSPQYPLYSDGASKRRWIYLPVGTAIDVSNPDEWIFPIGAILYKEFSVNGKKIETRVFEKVTNQTGFSAWRASVYVWLKDQTEAERLKVDNFYTQTEVEMDRFQAKEIASQYKMAALTQCQTCHGSAKDVSQGFNYLQLSDSFKPLNVLTLSQNGFFTSPIETVDQIKGTSSERNAIGYIQSNCATCHGGSGPGPHNFKHKSTSQKLSDEPLYKSILASPGLVTFADTANSRLFIRMSNGTMPKITLYVQDSAGLALLNNWIMNSSMPSD